MRYYSLENVLNLAHWTRRTIINEILAKEDVRETIYYHTPYRCPKCESLYNRFYIKIEYNENRMYETVFKCTKCKTILEELNEDELKVTLCPECGETKLGDSESLYILHWD